MPSLKVQDANSGLPSALKKGRVEDESDDKSRSSPHKTTFKIEGEANPTEHHHKNKYSAQTIDEMDVLIENLEKEIWALERKKRQIKASKASKNEKKGKLKPIEDELRVMKYQFDEMLYVKDQKIPFYEKLPKGS